MLRADRRAVAFFASKLRLQVVDGPCPVCHACGYLGSPFINNCGFDMAGAVFAHLLGRLSPRGDNILSHIIEVDQQQFFPPDTTPEALGMSTTAFAYVPASCSASASAESRQRCRIHVMYHGCWSSFESPAKMGIVRHAGFNAWAESNGIVVYY